jgi:hypothetical protein
VSATAAALVGSPTPGPGNNAIDPIEVFRARCEARAHLYGAGILDLHEALDLLHVDAVKTGLVAAIGQDRVQEIMTGAFGPIRSAEIAIETPPHDTERAASTEAALRPSHTTRASTVEALMYSLRGGLRCLADASTRDRLRRCDRAAMRGIVERLLNMSALSNGQRADWSVDDIAKLISLWGQAGGRI